MAATHQLVVQFAEATFSTHAALVAFEDRLRAYLPKTCEVDGHDVGSGTVNFFVYTSFPEAAYKIILRISTRAVQRKMRVAYRKVRGATFTNLWPRRDPRPFAYTYAPGVDPFAPASKREIPKRSPRGVRAK